MSHTRLTTCPGCPGRRDPGVHVAVVAVHEELPHRPAVMVAAREPRGERPQVFADCSYCSLAGPHPVEEVVCVREGRSPLLLEGHCEEHQLEPLTKAWGIVPTGPPFL